MKEIIYLCGFMGCGKSTVGKLLAKKMGVSFIDIDTEIVKEEGKDIPSIFAQDGEEYFRKLELAKVNQIAKGEQSAVVATGGGCLVNEQCQIVAKCSGVVVYIKLDFEKCYTRIKNDKNRPIATQSTKSELLQRYIARDEIYSKIANFFIECNGKSAQTVEEIMSVVKIDKNVT